MVLNRGMTRSDHDYKGHSGHWEMNRLQRDKGRFMGAKRELLLLMTLHGVWHTEHIHA